MGGLNALAPKPKKQKFMPVYADGGMAGDIDPEATAKIKQLQKNLQFRQQQYAKQQAQQGPQMAPQQPQQPPQGQPATQGPQMAPQGQQAPQLPGMAHGGMAHFEVGGMADQNAMMAAQDEEERRKQALLQSGAMDMGGEQGNFAPASTPEVAPADIAMAGGNVPGVGMDTPSRPLNPMQKLREQQSKLLEARIKAMEQKPEAEAGFGQKFFADPANAFFLNMISPSLGKAAGDASQAYRQQATDKRQQMMDQQKLEDMKMELMGKQMGMAQEDAYGAVFNQDGSLNREALAQLSPQQQQIAIQDYQARRKAGLGPKADAQTLAAQQQMGEAFENPRAKALWAEAQRLENMGDSDKASKFFQAAQGMEDKFHTEKSRKDERAEREAARREEAEWRKQSRDDQLAWQKQSRADAAADRKLREAEQNRLTQARLDEQTAKRLEKSGAGFDPVEGKALIEGARKLSDQMGQYTATSGIASGLKKVGIDTDASVAKSQMEQVSAQLTNSMPKPPGSLSDKDLVFLKQITGDLANEGNAKARASKLDALEDLFNRQIKVQQAYSAHVQSGKSDADWLRQMKDPAFRQSVMGAPAGPLPQPGGGGFTEKRPAGATDAEWQAYQAYRNSQQPPRKAHGGPIANDVASMRLAVGR